MRWAPRWLYIFLLCSLIISIVSFVEPMEEAELEETDEVESAGTLGKLGISAADLDTTTESPQNVDSDPLSPGDEFVPEKTIKTTPENEEAYQRALRFLERGRGHGIEGKRAAYIIFQKLAREGHADSMKLTAFSLLFGEQGRWSLSESHQLLTELAEKGSPDAQLGLGFMHATGLGLEKSDQAKALIHYMFSAIGGNPLAQMAMGYRYFAGVGVPQSCENALSYYEMVAKTVADGIKYSSPLGFQRIRLTDENDPTSNVAVTPLIDQNMLEYYRFMADKGDSAAQFGLGQLFLTGSRGVEQNYELASQYFSAAAEGGHAGAFALLGKMYLDGTPYTPQDNTTAFQFFLKSADKENPVGQAGLGLMYMDGRGITKNLEKAFKLFNLAAVKESGADAQLLLGLMFYKGIGVKRDFKAAIKYFQLASQNGHVLAYYNLALMHASGTGVLRSCNTAVELYKSVAERGKWGERLMEAYSTYKGGQYNEAAMKYLFLSELGYEAAQTNVGYILDRGEADSLFNEGGREEVLERAIVQWQRSANQEYWMARIKLGDYHYYGWGTPIDYGLAAQQYKLAADRHFAAQAMFNLGYMHENGMGLAKDLHLAKRLYDQAAEHSTDASIPVALALIKLSFVFALDAINKHPLIVVLDSYVGTHWDLVLITVLCALPALIFVLRRRGVE